MKPATLAMLLAAACLATGAITQKGAMAQKVMAQKVEPPAPIAPSSSDVEFAMRAMIGNTFEMQEGELALKQASDPKVKEFAQRMIADHGDAQKSLMDTIGRSGRSSALRLDEQHQAMLDNLKTFSGKDFDKIYIADQQAAHAETLALLLDYEQNGQNLDLKSWTKKVLPTVRMHLGQINAMVD